MLSTGVAGALVNDTDGDSDTLTAEVVTEPRHATSFSMNADGEIIYTPDAGYVGTDSFTYRVHDGAAWSNVATVTIYVTNQTPVAVNDTFEVHQGRFLSTGISGALVNDTDGDSDTLTAEVVTEPSHATSFTLYADGEIYYVPDPGYVGTDTFTYRVHDGAAWSNVATVTIHVTNRTPVAVNDVWDLEQDGYLTTGNPGVLANDNDADGDVLVPELVSGPSHGSLYLDSNGSVEYTPDTSFAGWDSFTYRLSDGAAYSNVATVTIQVIDPTLALISDKVWFDADEDGIQDSGEGGVAGVTVHLLDNSDLVLATTTTNASGRYIFGNLAEGDYRIEFVVPSGYLFTTKDQGSDDADSDAEPSTGRTGVIALDAEEQRDDVDAGLILDSVVTLHAAVTTTREGDDWFYVWATRTGSLTRELNLPITFGGTATEAVDYVWDADPLVVFGSLDEDVGYGFSLQAVLDTIWEETEMIVLTITPGSGYTVANPNGVTVQILEGDGPTVTPPDESVYCPCAVGPLPQVPNGASGNNPSGVSSGGVRLGDGTLRLNMADLTSSGFGLPWGMSRSWTNSPGYQGGSSAGSGQVVADLPYLRSDLTGDTLALITDGTSARFFDLVGSDYEGRFYLQDTLVHDDVEGIFTFTDPASNVMTFHDFASSYPGAFQSHTDIGGNVTEVISRDGDGRPTEVQREATVDSVTTVESYVYSYIPDGVNAGLMSSVTLRRKVGNGSWETVREAEYEYYGSSESHGNAGDLKTVVIQDGSSNPLDTKYYRYYKSGQSNGYVGGLKYLFNAESFARLAEAYEDPFAATDGEVSAYADLYLEYNGARQVTKQVLQGAGCSACTGGLGAYEFSYSSSPFANGYNSWRTKTVETLPDGNQNIVYTNFVGQVLLSVFRDTTTEDEWITFHKYDSDGRLLLTAHPSAVSGYDEEQPDLLHNQSGNYYYLRDEEGLIESVTYYSSTTADDTTPGGVTGYRHEVKLQRGETGTAIPQSTTTYLERSAGGSTIYPVAERTVYRNDNGTGAQTTSYSYTWFSGTVQMESMTVTLPVVSSGQNGPGSAETHTVYFDQFGRVIWSKDGEGFLTYTEYDQATGAVVKTITDVDTSETSDFRDLPSGWSTPGSGGLHLISTMEVDDQGRTTKFTDLNGNVTYTVYKDADHEIRTYRGWDATTDTPTGPIEVYRQDRAGSYTEMLTMSATPNVSNDRPTGTESISSIQTLSRTYTNAAGQVTHSDAYFNLSGLTYTTSTTLGTENTHFYRTRYGYENPRGWQDRVLLPTGTIYRTAFDGLGRVVSTWVGLDDTPTSGLWSPSNMAGTDLVKVSENEYDHGGVGDGTLTQSTQFPGGGEADRVTQYFYDWRNRLVAVKSGVQDSESTDTQRPIYYTEYDNLGRAIAREQYDGDNVSLSDGNEDGVPDKPSSSLLRARSTTSFDDRGRVYQQKTFSVDQSTGSVSSDALTTSVFYDRRGLVLKVSQPGGLVAKSQYDGAGRILVSYTTDGGGDSGWSDADDVIGDAVLEQTEYTYDDGGNVLLVTVRQRFHDETATGALGDPTTTPKARVSYAAMYYDLSNRLTDSVNVGTNGGSAYVRPGSAPSRSDTELVTSQSYDAAGRVEDVTDPRGIFTRTSYDALGRTVKVVEAYTDGTVSDTDDKTVEYAYDGSGQMLTLTARLTVGAYQTTEWVYGARIANGDGVNSNDLLVAMKYPDKSSGAPSNGEQENYTVNALGEVKTKTDRNGNVHTYTRDVLGRQTADIVTTLGGGVDGAVRRLEIAYDTAGRAYLFSSYDAATSGDIVNQVQREFDGLGQLLTEYQAHSGAVNTSTTPKVQYAYSEMGSSVNHSRLISMTYPNGRVLNYNYASGLDSNISRLSSLSDNSATLEVYSYLGLGTVVVRAHPEPDVDLTYVQVDGDLDANEDGGDQYTGLDRFGRVIDQFWWNNDLEETVDRFQYGYDRNGNRTYRENLIDAVFSELYEYDDLNQLTTFARGELSDGDEDGVPDTVDDPTRTQLWAFDALGNFESQTTDGTPESRTHNKQNQVTGVGSNTLTFDANGNLTTDEAGQQYVFDAWNRLVEVQDSGSSTLVSYAVDALGRRVVENPSTARDLLYSADWQVLEERVSGVVKVQNVWSPVYVDALVLRDRDADGQSGNGLEERLYAIHDANYNVTALVSVAGPVAERIVYDPFGAVAYLTAGWGSQGSSGYSWVVLHQGGRLDPFSGNYHSRNRDRRAPIGRWLTVDPLGVAAGDSNLYRDVGNNPVGHLDPLGLQPLGRGRGISGIVMPPVGGVLSWFFPPAPPTVAHPDPLPFRFRYCRRVMTGLADPCEQWCADNSGSLKVQHAYIGLLGEDGRPPDGIKAWGFFKGGLAAEKAFNPDHCWILNRCSKTLKHGSGQGKTGYQATVAEILECIEKHKPTGEYALLSYNCMHWAMEAADCCGLCFPPPKNGPLIW